MAHELCHVRRRDNLLASVHMVVEAVFWFHPLVWWIGARLVEERELACDEEVLRLGNEPRTYADGILNVCKSYVESPLRCVSGVTGSDLKKRIQAILAGCVARELNFGRKVGLAVAGILAVTLPVAVGVMNAPAARGQSAPIPKFEVASIKPCKGDSNRKSVGGRGGSGGDSSPGRLRTGCWTLTGEDNLGLIQHAYVRFAGAMPTCFRWCRSKEGLSGYVPNRSISTPRRRGLLAWK